MNEHSVVSITLLCFNYRMTFKTHLTPEDTTTYFKLLTTLEKKLSDICFVGDPHGHYSHIIDSYFSQAREAIFLGDFFSTKPRNYHS